MVLGLIFTVSLARCFGDVAFGKYSFALAFTALFAVLMDLGFNQLTIREVARDKTLAKKYMGNILIIKLLLSIIFFVLVVAAVNLMHYPSDTKTIVYIFGASTVLGSFSQLFRAIFHAFEKMEYDSLLTIIRQIIVVSIGLTLLFLGYDLIQVVSVYLIGGVINVVFSFIVTVKKFAKPKFEIDITFWKRTIITAIPFSLTVVFISIFDKIDIVMLSMMIGDAPVGWYNAAYMLVASLIVIPGVFLGAIYPVLSKFYVSSVDSLKITYEKSFRYLFIIAFPIGVGTTLLADKIILLIYGDGFVHSIIALRILIWLFVLSCANWLLSVVLQSINRQAILALFTGICAIFNVVSNLFFIPRMSYVGASITTIATESILFMLFFYAISKYLYRLSLFKIIMKPTIVGIVMGITIYYMASINLFVTVIIASAVYFAVLAVIGEITKEDIQLIRRVVGRD
ncbi:flippase [candidate division WOR-3 bacterium]|nr:flippase [candidate division WOR-3 bacterium]